MELVPEPALALIRRRWVKNHCPWATVIQAAGEDAYHRLIFPALCREARSQLTDSASEGAIQTFAANLKPLLLQPPVRGHVTLGLDPRLCQRLQGRP